jgi:hypothetical protein
VKKLFLVQGVGSKEQGEMTPDSCREAYKGTCSYVPTN